MRLSCLFLLLTGLLRALAVSTDYTAVITVPATVEAGTPFNATMDVQLYGLTDSSYAYAFRIYLATSYKDQSFYWYRSECM